MANNLAYLSLVTKYWSVKVSMQNGGAKEYKENLVWEQKKNKNSNFRLFQCQRFSFIDSFFSMINK